MKKQELIVELKNEIALYEKEKGTDITIGAVTALNRVITSVKQLDEPQKPVVPSCIDEYIKLNPEACPAELFSYDWLYDNPSNLEDDVAKWLFDNDSKKNSLRYLIAVQAFVTRDYKVEKEPVYYVLGKGNTYFDEFLEVLFNARWVTDVCFATPFKDKIQANAVATLTGGEVIEK